MAALFAPVITATKTDSPSSVSPGGTITYTVVISNSMMDATNVSFTDTIDANTTLVANSLRATPVAVNDSYSAIGNVRIQVPAANGVLANDFQGIPTAAISPTGSFTSANNGNVTLNADGSFSYNPPPGFEGTDTFTYTLTNSAGNNNATVSITVSGMIWFINNNPAAPGGAPGDGRLTNPFKLLATFAGVNNGTGNNPAANDNIFIYREVATDYSATLTLLNGQKLIGQGASASLSAITGLTPPSFSDPFPATGGTNPNITSTGVAITLANGNLIRGLNVGDTTTTDISGTNFGTLNIGEVALTGTGQALNLTTGTLSGPTASTASFTSISSTNSPTTGISLTSVSGNMTSGSTTITNPTGIGLSVNTSSATLNFGNTTANQSGGAGVSLTTNTGPITFADLDIAPDANQKGLLATDNTTTITATSGTISTSTANAATNAAGVEITRASSTTPLAIALTSVSASGGTNGIILSNTSGSFTVNGDGTNTAVGGNSTGGTISNKSGADGAVAGNGIYLSSTTNVTLRRMTINGTNQNHGIRGINSSNFTLEFSTVSGTNGTSTGLDEGSVNFDNLLGSAAITSCLIDGGLEDNLNVVNTSGTLNRLTVSGSTFGFNNTANGNNNILIESQNAGTTLNFTLKSSLIKGARADWISVSNNSGSTGDLVIGGPNVADGNTFDNLGANAHPGAAAGGNRVVFGGVGNSTVDIRNNTTKGSKGEAIRVRATQVSGTVGTVNARVRNNTVGVAGTANSGSSEGSGIFCFSDGGGKLTVAITDNQVFQYNNSGIRLDFGDEIVNGSINNATVTGNTVSNPGNLLTDFNGFHLNNGTVAATDDFTTCLHLSGNTLTGSGSGTVSPNNQEFRLRQRQSTTVRLPGYGGGNTDTTAVVNFIRGQNTVTAGNGAASVQVPPGGGFIGGAACTSPSFALADSQGFLSKVETDDSAIENPDRESGLRAEHGEAKPNDEIHKLKQSELEWLIPAAIERWRQAGIAAEDLARLQNVRFELADLPEGEIARVDGEVVKIDELAAGYGWFVDLTFFDDNEFTVGVPERELQTTETSLAHGRVDLLTVVMRELGVEYLKGRTRVPKKLRPLMEATLSPSVRRVPNAATIGFIIPEATSDDGSGNLQGNEQIKLEPAPSNASSTNNQQSLESQKQANQNAVNSPKSGETVNVGPIPVLPVGESVTITFQVTVDNTIAPTDCDVSNQGTVSGSNFANVLTDDPAVGGAADPTLTTVVQPIVLSACPANITGNTDPNQCTRVVTYTAPTATGCPTPTVSCVPASGFAFPKGTTTVTCTASNGVAPNQTCTFTVTVNDAQPPTITCPANITQGTDAGVCTAVVNFAPTANDNCTGVTFVCTPASGSTFPKGTTTVNCTASDTATPPNTASCSFTVTVNDNQPPQVTCPANVTTNTDPGVCTAVVNYTTPTPTDNCPNPTVVCVPPTGTAFAKGTTTVTCTASDTATPPNTAQCTFTVTVNDNQPPQVTCPANITQSTDAGVCTAVVNYTTPTATDNCPNPTVVCTPASGSTFAKGTTTVTCTASDTATPPNTAQCTFTVTINDTQPPSLTCPANITQGTDAGVCTAVVNYTTPTATDNCPPTSITATCNPPAGSTFPKGTTTVTCTASDTATPPNTSTCTFTVTVNDTQPPSLTCPANVTTNTAPNQCQAVVTYTTPTATDNCPPTSITATCNPPSGSTFPKGTTTVTCTASDGTNTAQCTFTVTVNDTQPPAITCPSNINVTSPDNNCVVVNYTTPTPTDNCPNPTASCTPPSGTCFAVGTTTVTCTASDTAMPPNTTQCTFTVTVVPCTITCPANVTVSNDANQCGATVNYPPPTTGGSCGTVTCTPPSGSFFPKGTTTVTCSTQTGPSCTFTVTVNDTQPPTISCPTNITVPNDPGQCAAVVGFAPTVGDNCPMPTFVCTPPAGSAFPKGTTTVNCTATDMSGNTASCSFTVTVNDTQPPVITCPANVTQPADAGQCSAVVTYPNATAMDNCSGVGTPSCTPPSGSTFNMGTTTVTCNVADAMGNPASCSFTVTVTDTQPPTVTCPANITRSTDPNLCTAVVTYTTPTGTDNCTLPPNAVVCTPASGSVFQKGTTTVTCTVTDSSNLTGTCNFTITVNDTQPPQIFCPADVIQGTDPNQCQAVVNYSNATATDNCPNVGTPSCTPPSGSVFPKGTTTVNCTVSDESNNSASCSFTVTVNDTQPPVITCPANVTTNTDPGVCTAVVNYAAPTVTDNCPPPGSIITPKKKNKPTGAGGFTPVCTPPSGSTFNKGVTTVNCTVADASGNTASCSFTVTVNDTQPPVLTCPANQVRPTDPNLCTAVVSYPAPTATDNCPGVGTPSCNPPSGSVFAKGVTTVNCTVSDAMGNPASCSFTVTVNDTQMPSITCPANITAPINGGNCVVVNYPPPVATDNCPGVTFNCVPPSGTCFPLGTTTVTCTATDTSGNTKSCSFTVTTFDVCIQDDGDPTLMLMFNSNTGDYLFCCGTSKFVGQGTVKKKGNILTLTHNTTDRRLLANVTLGGTGVATLQSPPGTMRCTITDRNVTNNSCTCTMPNN